MRKKSEKLLFADHWNKQASIGLKMFVMGVLFLDIFFVCARSKIISLIVEIFLAAHFFYSASM